MIAAGLHNRWDLAGKVQDQCSLLVIIQIYLLVPYPSLYIYIYTIRNNRQLIMIITIIINMIVLDNVFTGYNQPHY